MQLIRALWSIISAIVVFAAVAFGVYWIFTDPRSPLPGAWNPLEPLQVSDAVTPVTGYKLRRVLDDPEQCLVTLEQVSEFRRMEPLLDSAVCGIPNRVDLRSVAGVNLRPLETSCETALRLSLWVEHGLKPAALEHFQRAPQRLQHIGSYNCRPIRGSSTRMSTHATASSIDIAGVTLEGGAQLSLLRGWSGPQPEPAFFMQLRDAGCDWFQTVLGPEFNALHADHYHFQARGWGTCR